MRAFKLKEIIIIPIVVALMFVMGYFLIPIMSVMPLPAYRALVVAPIYGIGITLALSSIRRIGVVSVIGLLIGVILSAFSIIMLIVSALSGLMTDIICIFMRDQYRKDPTILIAAGLFPALQIPLVFYTMAYTVGGAFEETIKTPIIMIIPTITTFLLSFYVSRKFYGVWKKRGVQN